MNAPAKRLSEWRDGAEAAVILVVTWIVLPVLSLRLIVATLRLTVGPADETALNGRGELATHRVRLAIERAAGRLPMNVRCLHKALAGAMMLHRRGLPATVVLGVCSMKELKAHAWLLSAGTPVLGWEPTLRFVPLVAFSSKRAKVVRSP